MPYFSFHSFFRSGDVGFPIAGRGSTLRCAPPARLLSCLVCPGRPTLSAYLVLRSRSQTRIGNRAWLTHRPDPLSRR